MSKPHHGFAVAQVKDIGWARFHAAPAPRAALWINMGERPCFHCGWTIRDVGDALVLYLGVGCSLYTPV